MQPAVARNNIICTNYTTFTPETLLSSVGSYHTYAVRFLLGKEHHMGILHFGNSAPETLHHPGSQPLATNAAIACDSMFEVMSRKQFRSHIAVFIGKFTVELIESLAPIVIQSLVQISGADSASALYHWCGRFTIEMVKQLGGHVIDHTLFAADKLDGIFLP